MKNILALVLALAASVSFAGDDPVAQVSYTGTAACSSALRARYQGHHERDRDQQLREAGGRQAV